MNTVIIKITPEIRRVLEGAEFDGGELMHIRGQLDRKLYMQVMEVLEQIGGKWIRGKKAHSFAGKNAEEVIAQVLNEEFVVDIKKTFHLFETPEAVVDDLLYGIHLSKDDRILEPSAGKGAILRVLDKETSDPLNIDVCEIQPGLAQALRDEGRNVVCEDFLAYKPDARGYDVIIANPPFKGEVEHVRHMWEHLAPGGHLVTVMSNAIEYKITKKYIALRTFIYGNGGTIDRLPEDAFKESGTRVQAAYVTLDKADDYEPRKAEAVTTKLSLF